MISEDIFRFSFGGRVKDIAKTPGFKTTFKADYVRVWQKEAK